MLMRNLLIPTLLLTASAIYANDNVDFDKDIQAELNHHYNTYKNREYFSGAALSVYLPQKGIKNYYVGNVSHDANSAKVSHDTLFQIGSITKSFTAAVILQLAKENKLGLADPLKKWLPSYVKWSSVTIQQLLNMTSGLPNYTDNPLWNAKAYTNPMTQWTTKELVAFAYPPEQFSPPLKTTYFYTNTGYILTDMIIEKATGHSFKEELETRTLKKALLQNTYYPLQGLDRTINSRLAAGYNFNPYDNTALVGKNIQSANLAWAGAAGALLSNTEDIVKWVNALFVENDILDAQQKEKLKEMVSTKTGKPLKATSFSEPQGFGLGVAQLFDKNIGRFWFYEGETLGFRAFYIYVPCNGVIISSVFNSATNTENDHSSDLIKNIYRIVIKSLPKDLQKICLSETPTPIYV